MKTITDLKLRLQRAWCALRHDTLDLDGISLEQRQRVECAASHDWTFTRGFWKCPICQPERRRRKPIGDLWGTDKFEAQPDEQYEACKAAYPDAPIGGKAAE